MDGPQGNNEGLFNQYSFSPKQNEISRHQIQEKRTTLDTLLTSDTEKALRWSKAKFLLYSNSSSTMFARKLNQSIKPPHIYRLRNNSGNVISHPKGDIKIFLDFYKKLLSTPQNPPKQSSLHWINEILLLTLSIQQIKILNAPCSDTEINRIIGSLKTSTAPGPDGYSTSHYKKNCLHINPSPF